MRWAPKSVVPPLNVTLVHLGVFAIAVKLTSTVGAANVRHRTRRAG